MRSLAILQGRRYLSKSRILWSSHRTDPLGKRNTLTDIKNLYANKIPISVVTAYDYITANFAASAGIDINLVGDSLANTALGYEDTNVLSYDEFKYHAQAVSRGNRHSFLIADMPFGSFEVSENQAVKTAINLVKECGMQGVKIEGGAQNVALVKRLQRIGIPVISHVGLTPQSHNSYGGFKVQGNSVEVAERIFKDCLALEDAGAFGFLIECVPSRLAKLITENLSVPTIGIGAGPFCSGQVLVMADVLGMTNSNQESLPKFAKQYTNTFENATKALTDYKNEVLKGSYPDIEKHSYKIKSDVLSVFKGRINAIKDDHIAQNRK